MHRALISMSSRSQATSSWLRNAALLSGLREPLVFVETVLNGSGAASGTPASARSASTKATKPVLQQAKLREDFDDVHVHGAEGISVAVPLRVSLERAADVAGDASQQWTNKDTLLAEEEDGTVDIIPEESATEAAASNSVPIDDFDISAKTKAILKKERGIEGLFPIQAACFEAAFAGKDVVGRAKTGTGKTLAFALPLVERMLRNPRPLSRGRTPRVVVMAPTRELARQIASEFSFVCGPQGLSVLALYGGSQFGPQEAALRTGVDVVVGTPGRLLDHLDRKTLLLGSVESFVMDEADMMLDMGFVEDMDAVLNAVKEAKAEKEKPLQTLLFSATFPEWVRKISKRFLRAEETVRIDLVGKDDAKMADTVRHYAIPVPYSPNFDDAIQMRIQILAETIRAFSNNSRTIVFTSTKKDVDVVVDALAGRHSHVIRGGAAGLHGDVQQATRDRILTNFRNGTVPILVATDVAARGLDIPSTGLVVHYSPPSNPEAFVHRSGRTGRANTAGTSVTLFKVRGKEQDQLETLAKFAGINFTHTVVQPRDILAEIAKEAIEKVGKVPKIAAKSYEPFAQKLIDQAGEGGALKVVSSALAALVSSSHKTLEGHGHHGESALESAIHTRGLLTGKEGHTCLYTTKVTSNAELRNAVDAAGLPFEIVKAILASNMANFVNGNPVGIAFEVPSEVAPQVLEALGETIGVEEVDEIEGMLARSDRRSDFARRSSFGGSRSSFRGGFGSTRRDDDFGERRSSFSRRDGDRGGFGRRDRDDDRGSRDFDRGASGRFGGDSKRGGSLFGARSGGRGGGRSDFGSRTSIRFMSIYSRQV